MALVKPEWAFDWEREWLGLTAFAADPASRATLGVVADLAEAAA